jgi:hypothetical protein
MKLGMDYILFSGHYQKRTAVKENEKTNFSSHNKKSPKQTRDK